MSQDNAITCNFPQENFFNQPFVASPLGVDCKSFPSGLIFPSLMTFGVPICVMTRIFRDPIARKVRRVFIKISNFSGILTQKNSGHDADGDTIGNL